MQRKSVEDKTPAIRVTAMPADTNPYGGVFGGWLMSQMALAAGSLASRTARGKCVVVAADELRFTGAMAVGDELSVFVTVEKQGRTSLTIAVDAVARERDGEGETPVASGVFTFVALDGEGRPKEVTPLPAQALPESPSPARGEGSGAQVTDPSPLAGEGGTRTEGVGGRGAGGDSRHKTVTEAAACERLMKGRAKAMRSSQTDAEHRLWQILRAKRLCDLKWRRQVEFGDRYIADFVCFSRRLIVEADGGQHSEKARDVIRDAWFVDQGFRVLRFWNNDIMNNPDGVVDMILHAVASSSAADAALPLSPTPPPQGGRGKLGASHG
jgi:acyl-CoA thioesterase YciA